MATEFALDERLERDSRFLTVLGLCQLRLMRDAQWPWLLLVPQRADASEIFELTPLDQAVLTFETSLCAKALKEVTGCTKVNIGALGNQVRQLHFHIVARTEDDPAWPGPVWGEGKAEPYDAGREKVLIDALLDAL